MARTHLVIPDTQVAPGVPTDHLRWIGQYILDRKPDVVVHLGDHWDMPSLSSYDRGKKAMEGRRYAEDVEAGNKALALLTAPLNKANWSRRKRGTEEYKPRLVLLRGNHEDRIRRAIEDDPRMDGAMSFDHLESPGWEVHDFLKPVFIDGVGYAHFWANPMSGKPLGGMIETRLKTIGHSFTMGHVQTLQTGMRFIHGPEGERQQRGLVAGACLTPDHRVLTADLRYVPLGKVEVGDQLVSFDENVADSPGRARRYKTGTVRAVKADVDEVFAVRLSNGKVIQATADHLWLVKQGSMYVWRRTDSLRRGTRIPQVMQEWEELDTRAAGYLAGMFDGEGCYYTRVTSGGVVGQLGLSQKPGAVLDETRLLLEELVGADSLGSLNQQGVVTLRVGGGLRNIARLLGSVRPIRLLAKFQPEHLGRLTTPSADNPSVVSIEPLGRREIVRIDIDAKTMVVEGMPHHNCYLHDEDYKGHQGNAHWRGVLVKHQVHDGGYNLMEVDLDFLCRKYEGVPLAEFMAEAVPAR
jgi:hypothetical protein